MKEHALKGRSQSPEHIRKRMEAVAKAKAAWTEEQRKQHSDKIRAANSRRDPELQQRFAHCRIGRTPWNKGKSCPQLSGEHHWNWGNKMPQESIEKIRKSLTGKKQSPELIAKRFTTRAGYRHSEETKARIGRANSGVNNGMSGRTGELNPTWRGGLSFEPYPTTWTFALREMIRDRDGRKCCFCGVSENGKRHDVHHIDYDKKNIMPDNLLTLCVSCHRKTNYNREQWKQYFIMRLIVPKTGTDD